MEHLIRLHPTADCRRMDRSSGYIEFMESAFKGTGLPKLNAPLNPT